MKEALFIAGTYSSEGAGIQAYNMVEGVLHPAIALTGDHKIHRSLNIRR